MAESTPLERRDVRFRGMVQGVGFRYTTRKIAAGFAVNGYVQNLSDGSVLVVAEGTPQELDRFLAAVRSEMEGYIEGMEPSIQPVTGEFRRFEIRR